MFRPRGSGIESAAPATRAYVPRIEPSRHLFGEWRSKAPVVDQGLRKVYLSLEILADRVVFRPDCRYLDGTILQGKFATRAAVEGQQIKILESGAARVEFGQNACVVSVTPMDLLYVLRGNELSVAFDGLWVEFTRR